MNHSWNHDPFQGGGPVPHRPKKQRKPIGTPLGRTLLNLAVTLIFGAVYFYIVLPPLNLHSGEFYVFVLLLCAVYCGCAILTSGFQGSGAKGYFGFVKKQCTVPLCWRRRWQSRPLWARPSAGRCSGPAPTGTC